MDASSIRVLVVEDNPGDMALIKASLEEATRCHFGILCAETLAAAKRLLRRESVDVVLLDLTLPDSVGLMTVDEILAIAPDVPIVVHTVHDDYDMGHAAIRRGCEDFVSKGGKDPRLLRRILNFAVERKKLEQGTRISEARFRDYAEAGSEWFWETDSDHRITMISGGFEKATETSAPEIIGQTRQQIMTPETAEIEIASHLDDLRNLRPFRNFQYPYRRADGELRIIRVSGRPIFMNDRFIGYRGVGMDVTVFHRQDKELQARVEEAELARQALERQATEMAGLVEEVEAQREKAEAASQSKSEFLATMSHEIRTPMTGVLGLTNLLLESQLSTEQKEYSEAIRDSGRTLLNLINDILDVSKIEAGQMKLEEVDFPVRPLLRSAQELFRERAEVTGNVISLEIDEELPNTLRGDPHRLKQVLFNLVGNAIKFTERGNIYLRARALKRSSDAVVLLIEVIDTGRGMSPEVLGRIFERFSQAASSTARTHGGTGLGLTISRQLVALMGGEIEAESTEGKGSTFRFTVKLESVTKQVNSPPQPAPAERLLLDPGLEVLVAEDNRINRMLISALLQGVRRIDIVQDGREAVDAALSHDYDVILMDMRMPRMDGCEATRSIRAKEKKPVPVIALSADVAGDGPMAACESLLNGFVAKPIDQVRLYEAIAQCTGTEVTRQTL